MKPRAVPLLAVGIAGLLLASAVGAVVVSRDDEAQVSTDATTTSSFPPFEESTTTSSVVDPAIPVVTEPAPVAPPSSIAPVAGPAAATTTSAPPPPPPPTPVLATDPAPCPIPPSQPPAGAPAGPGGVFAVTVGTGAVRLTNPIGRLPAWRPRTNQVVTVSVASGAPSALCLSAPDGGGARRLVTPVGIGRPALSPDGARVAVRSARPGVVDLVAFSVEGADQKVLLQGPEISDPVWLGNGSAVVTCAVTGGARRLVAVPAGGGEPRVLRDTCPGGPVSSSPDGTRLAFAQADQVIVLNTTNRSATNLRMGTSVSTEAPPSWSPDGRKVAFAFSDAQGAALGVLDLAAGSGSGIIRQAGLTTPSWAPAGDLIAFVGRNGAGLALSVARSDATGRRVVAACQTRCLLGPQPWATDNTAVALELTGAPV